MIPQNLGLDYWLGQVHARILCLALLVIILSSCLSSEKLHTPPFGADTSVPTGTPESVQLDATILASVTGDIRAKKKHKIHSMLIARHGLLVHEEYFNGFGPETPHDLRSATKSITSLLTGIAIDQGTLDLSTSLRSLVIDEYPSSAIPEQLQLRHLLTMSSGLDCDDSDRSTRGQEDRMYRSNDWLAYFLSLDQISEPGQETRYCTGGVIALGAAIAAATHMDFARFAELNLFKPLGINNFQWARYNNDQGVDSGGHLLLTPRAMTKIGMLVSQSGLWNENRIVSESWINRSTSRHTQISNNPYGYLWWRNILTSGNKSVTVISARGNGGQVIFIVPEYDLVAVFTAGYYNSEDVQIVYDIFHRAVLPSVRELQPYLQVASDQ